MRYDYAKLVVKGFRIVFHLESNNSENKSKKELHYRSMAVIVINVANLTDKTTKKKLKKVVDMAIAIWYIIRVAVARRQMRKKLFFS